MNYQAEIKKYTKMETEDYTIYQNGKRVWAIIHAVEGKTYETPCYKNLDIAERLAKHSAATDRMMTR